MSTPDETKPLFIEVYWLGGYSSNSHMIWYLPSGKRLHNYGKIHHAING